MAAKVKKGSALHAQRRAVLQRAGRSGRRARAHRISDKGDNTLLLPTAEAAKEAVGNPESLNVVADGGYSNSEQAEACEAKGPAFQHPRR
jgi:hypothetical protein